MSFTSKEMLQLEGEAQTHQFSSKSDVRFLSQILKSLSDGKDPVDVLALLVALWSTGAASRSEEQEALNRVGKWLENSLNTNPTTSQDLLALKVGWLKRFTTIHRPTQKTTSKNSGPPTKLELQFGRSVSSLRSTRQKTLQPVVVSQPKIQASSTQPQFTQSNTELWPTAYLVWTPSSQEISVTMNNKKAFVRQAAAQAIMKTLPEDVQAKIKKKQEFKSVQATVKPLGNSFEIIAIVAS
jgi:hypothetical protein